MPVTLRPASSADLDRLRALLGRESVARAVSPLAPDALATAVAAGTAVVVEDDGAPAGVACWTVRSERSRIASIHTVAIDPAHQGRGVAVAALRALVALLVDERGFHRLEAETYAFNAAGRRAFAAAGFAEEGVRRRAYDRHGAWQDGILLGLVAEDR